MASGDVALELAGVKLTNYQVTPATSEGPGNYNAQLQADGQTIMASINAYQIASGAPVFPLDPTKQYNITITEA